MKLATVMNADVEKRPKYVKKCYYVLLTDMPHKNQKFRTALSNRNKMRTTNVSHMCN